MLCQKIYTSVLFSWEEKKEGEERFFFSKKQSTGKILTVFYSEDQKNRDEKESLAYLLSPNFSSGQYEKNVEKADASGVASPTSN